MEAANTFNSSKIILQIEKIKKEGLWLQKNKRISSGEPSNYVPLSKTTTFLDFLA
jgi:hypothetical protein